jgi:AcrR family transcriptional regulator
MSEARDRWLDEGLVVLAAEGAAGVRIDRIAARLGLSKGSFHHHFEGAEGFKRALLARFEEHSIGAVEAAIADAEAEPDATPRDVLERLTRLVGAGGAGGADRLYRPALEVAVRAWATSDPEVQAAQARVDAARLAALQRVWRPLVATDAQARQAALLPYLVAVGAVVLAPPVAPEELRGVFELLLPLVPEETLSE